MSSSAGERQAGAVDATITYAYNGLGQVTRKTESNGDYIDYAYDVGGRQTMATKSAFTDYLGNNVQLRTVYEYNGLNNLARMSERKASGTSADDRLTTFTYGAGGRMSAMTDATGFTRNYAYDTAGRVVKESYTRTKSDSTTVTEARAWRYDALGRVTLESTAVLVSSNWEFGDTTHYRYNSYGEVTGKGVTGEAAVAPVYQEIFDYDAGGRLWRTNADTGSTRIFFYDKGGKVTLEIGSAGTDLASHSAASALALLTNSGANAVGAVAVDGVVATITTYDKRGQATSTREPQRQLEKTGATTFTMADIVKGRAYNAFGEVLSETDARGHTTDFAYNTMGRLVLKTSPEVRVTGEDGGDYLTRPEEKYYYDISGRLIATEDANGNVERRTLLAGTGHGGEEAKVTAKFHADPNNVERIGYDFLGNARKFTNGLGAVENRTYDKAGRVLTIQRPLRTGGIQLTENYTYDGLGQRLAHWNSQFGSGVKETIDYDYKGRVTRMQDFGGNVTTYAYTWESGVATSGLGTFGAWKKITTIPAGKASTEKTGYFGHLADKIDYGLHDFAFTYDKGGRLVTQTNSANQNITYTWFNTGLMAGNVDATGFAGYYGTNVTAKYAYDANGNRLKENYTSTTWTYNPATGQSVAGPTVTHQNAVVAYDALNRMLTFSDNAGGSGAEVDISYEYDAVGNVRRMKAEYPSGGLEDYWYAYDGMNRFVTVKGMLSGEAGEEGTQIVRGHLGGLDITYDAAGRRATETSTYRYEEMVWYPTPGFVEVEAHSRIHYIYTADGYLAQTQYSSAMEDEPFGALNTWATYTRDALGRVTQLVDGGITKTTTYNNKSEITFEYETQNHGSGHQNRYSTWYQYNLETSPGVFNGAYQGGLVTHIRTDAHIANPNGTMHLDLADSQRRFTYEWWDGGLKTYETVDTNDDSSSDPIITSDLRYDTSGQLTSVYINDGSPRTVTYVNDVMGQVLERKENSERNVYYYFNGKRVGELKYAGTSLTQASFDQAYDRVGDRIQPGPGVQPTATRYTVREGDTFAGIAELLWGDAALWWMIAETNGMTGDSELAAGMTLTIPNKVHNQHYNTDTFRPYDPNKAIGNTSPTKPKPIPPPERRGDGCGVAQIFVAIIAIAVVALVMPHAIAGVAQALGGTASVSGFGLGAVSVSGLGTFGTAASYVAGGAIAGAAGSVVSQGAAIAMGVQDKFSWNAVALSALGSGVSAGLSQVGPLAAIKGWEGAALRGMASNAITQGVGVATGMQDKFSWAGVAVAGVVSGVGYAVADAIGGMFGGNPSRLESLAIDGASNLAGGIAGAAALSLIEGSDFGDNMMAVLPDVIGATIGNMVAGGVSSRGNRSSSMADGSDPIGDILEKSGGAWGESGDGGLKYFVNPDYAEGGGSDPIGDLIDIQTRALAAGQARGVDGFWYEGYTATGNLVQLDAPYFEGEDWRFKGAFEGSDTVFTYNGTNNTGGYELLLGGGASRAAVDALVITADRNRQLNGPTLSERFQSFGRGVDTATNIIGVPLVALYDGFLNRGVATVEGAWEAAIHPIKTARAIGAAVGRGYHYLSTTSTGDAFADAGRAIGNGLGSYVSDRVGTFQKEGYYAGAAKLGRDLGGAAFDGVTIVATGGAARAGAGIGDSVAVLGGRKAGLALGAENEVEAIVRTAHKNSLDYVGDTHVYVIRNPDGTLYKVGESAQGVRVSDGASIRAEQQARALQRETGDFYTTEIRQNFGGKADARAYETRFIQTYERLYGRRPPGNPLDR